MTLPQHAPRRTDHVDAAFLFRTSTGARELALVEWKYTESYRPRRPEPVKDEVRRQRYGTALHDPDGPVRSDVAYGESLRPEHREVGDTVHDVWHALLRRPDRFLSLDSSVFADRAVTSQEYVDRYGEKDGSHDQ